MNIRPFIVLSGTRYYPSGWGDFKGATDSIEEARTIADRAVEGECFWWWEVIDLRIMQVVETKSSRE